MPKKITQKIKITQERKFSSHFLDLRKIAPEEQEFERPKRRTFLDLLRRAEKSGEIEKIYPESDQRRKKGKLKINFITPGEKRFRREKEEFDLKKKLMTRYFHFNLKLTRSLEKSSRLPEKSSRLSEVSSSREQFTRSPEVSSPRERPAESAPVESTGLFPIHFTNVFPPRIFLKIQNKLRRRGSIIYFILTCLFFTFFLQAVFSFQELKNKKQIILNKSFEAYENLSSGEFEKAKKGFWEAQDELNQFGVFVHLAPHFWQAKHLMEAGELIAEAGEEVGKLESWKVE